MDTEGISGDPIYSPSAVLNLFSNALMIAQSRKLIQLKGVFLPGKGQNYNGYYYDSLRDESSDAQLTIVIPALIRHSFESGKTITVNGYITKRVVNSGSRIDIQLNITELIAQTHNKYSEEELKAIEILQAKASKGYRDVHSWIKERIVNEQRFKIVIIIGKTGIIDNDIKHQLRESIGFYDLTFHRINLNAQQEIIAALNDLDKQGFDIIAISRGGGENLEIFNKPVIADACIALSALFVTAIGHKDDNTLLQKIADKAFITPSELGQFLNDVYNHTTEEIQHSKAKLVQAITAQLTANYSKQVDNLKEQLKASEALRAASSVEIQKISDEKISALNSQLKAREQFFNEQVAGGQKLHSEKLQMLNEQLDHLSKDAHAKDQLLVSYKKQIAYLKSEPSLNWRIIIIAVAVGILIGLIFKR